MQLQYVNFILVEHEKLHVLSKRPSTFDAVDLGFGWGFGELHSLIWNF